MHLIALTIKFRLGVKAKAVEKAKVMASEAKTIVNALTAATKRHGRRKRGYAGDLTPTTIYVEGILICISP